jgi:hypothetical protein
MSRDPLQPTLGELIIVPPELENSCSIADTPINSVYLLGKMHIVDLNLEWFNNQPVHPLAGLR